MDEKEIKEILLGPYRTPEYFNKMTVIELCEIMDFCKSSFRNKKQNWSITNTANFCEGNGMLVFGLYQNMCNFYSAYRRRKKKYKGFENYIVQLHHHCQTRGALKIEKVKPKLLDETRVKEFLSEMRGIKGKYLDVTDDLFLNFISKGIKTGLTQSTLKKYYYEGEEGKKKNLEISNVNY